MVKPRPFNMLPKVVDTNISGHSQASMIIKSPASLELKKYVPINFPERIKKIVQKIPNREQYFIVLDVKVLILVKSLSDLALDTMGRSILATAHVIVEGNNIKGIAIAVKIP